MRGKSHVFYRVFAGTWAIFLSYGWDNPSKLLFVQRCPDSCIVRKDTSGISTRLDRAIQTLFQVRQEMEDRFLVATVILGFLSVFKKSQATSFEALNSACLSRGKRDVRPPVQI